ncbi:hypothetical protein F5X96DRAFT_651144 [Biscogniauxia mediterranea]|nr:hypothetical protein F5X96DRAFT_651144 [Biscogniauxia mediterranea]
MEDSQENGRCKKNGKPTRSQQPATRNWVSMPIENGPENEYIIYNQPADKPLPELPNVNYRRGLPRVATHPKVEQNPRHVDNAESLQPSYVDEIQEYIENLSISTPEPYNSRQYANSGSYTSIPSPNLPTIITITPTPDTNPSAEDQAHSLVYPAAPSSLSSTETDSHANLNASDPHEDIPEFPYYYSFGILEEPSDPATMESSPPMSSPATGDHRQHHLAHGNEDPQGDLGGAKLKVDEGDEVNMEPIIEDLGSDELGSGDAEIHIEPIYEDEDADNKDGDEPEHEKSPPNWAQRTLPIDSIPANSRRASDPTVLLYGSSPLRQVTYSWEVAGRIEGRARPMKRLRLSRSGRSAGFVDGQNETETEGEGEAEAEAIFEPQSSPSPLLQSLPSPELGHDAMMEEEHVARPAETDVSGENPTAAGDDGGGDMEMEMEEQEDQERAGDDDENKENENGENAVPAPARTRNRRGGARIPLQTRFEELEVYSHFPAQD